MLEKEMCCDLFRGHMQMFSSCPACTRCSRHPSNVKHNGRDDAQQSRCENKVSIPGLVAWYSRSGRV
eukprot:1158313-Pelagomonas_calceolata.AAC.11